MTESVLSYQTAKDLGTTPSDSLARGTPLVEVRDLKTHFPIKRGVLSRTVGQVKAVDGVSFNIEAGKTLGLVGESGCGKTTVGRSILRLIRATSGQVLYRGTDFFSYKGSDLRRLRRKMQIIFQDPVSSLNPRMTVATSSASRSRFTASRRAASGKRWSSRC